VTGDNGLKAPFPWFGGKSRAAAEVSAALGDIDTYCEPFAGSLAVLLQRQAVTHEVVNDADGWLVNFWRAVRAAAADVVQWCDWPVTELDLTARHAWLVREGPRMRALMEADPEAFDAKAAGWWVWGISSWIGGYWCSGQRPWQVAQTADGPLLVHAEEGVAGVSKKIPHLGNAGNGVHRILQPGALSEWFEALCARLRRVRVICGDFERVLSESVLHVTRTSTKVAGVLLDPPYPAGKEQVGLYAGHAGHADEVWQRAIAWATANGANPKLRLVMCGYEGMWEPPAGWTVRLWDNVKGYKRGSQQEVLWCSPHCVEPDKRQLELF